VEPEDFPGIYAKIDSLYRLSALSDIHLGGISRSDPISTKTYPTLRKCSKSLCCTLDSDGVGLYDPDLADVGAFPPELFLGCPKGGLLEYNDAVDFGLLRTGSCGAIQPFPFAEGHDLTRFDANRLHSGQNAHLTAFLQNPSDSDRTGDVSQEAVSQSTDYLKLRRVLNRFQLIARKGGWPTVPDGRCLKKGDRGERVALLRARLITSGDLDSPDESLDDLFGDELEQAVRKFQGRHGIDVDGIVGPNTIAALNVPVEERLQQIRLNLERLRQSPFGFDQRFILVNTANYELTIVENGQTVMKMRAVVGRPDRPTPVFSAKMTYLVVNPYWHVPARIARQDILPKIRTNPDYLFERNIKVFEVTEGQMVEVDPQTIDWHSVSANSFHYRLRQEPGPLNALGRVKFMFPNKFEVYIHDTSARQLFDKTQRNYSSGCIRIEDPFDLAEYLLRGNEDWTREKILAAVESGKTRIVNLPEPINIHLLYLTAWVDDTGNIQFRSDIYGRDSALAKALSEKQSIIIPVSNS